MLRREGIYSSYLTTWRKQRELGELDGLAPQKRGPKPDPQAIELAKLRRENARLQERLRHAGVHCQSEVTCPISHANGEPVSPAATNGNLRRTQLAKIKPAKTVLSQKSRDFHSQLFQYSCQSTSLHCFFDVVRNLVSCHTK